MLMTKKQDGQIMIEAIVAISMVTIGLLGIITLLINSSRWNRDVSHELVATYLAAEGVEVMKNLIDASIASELRGDTMATWNAGLPEGLYEIQHGAAFGSDGTLPGTPGARQISPNSAQKLMYDSGAGAYQYGSGDASPFSRVVQVIGPRGGSDTLLVSSTVFWDGQEGVENIHLEDVFTYWRGGGL